MKFIFNDYAPNSCFDPCEEKWNPIKELSNYIRYICIIPLGILISFGLYVILYNNSTVQVDYDLYLIMYYIIAIIISIPLHEIIHSVFFPDFLFSDDIYFGYIAKNMTFYTHTNSAVKKNRMLIVILAPLIILSIIPAFFFIYFKLNSLFLFVFIIINAVLASNDIISFFVYLFKIPKGSLVRNKGKFTYWKME